MKQLKLNGKPFEISAPPTMVKLVVELLTKLPADELLDTSEIGKRVGRDTSNGNWCRINRHPLMQPHVLRHGTKNYFGSKAAIDELRRRLNEAG